MKCVRWACAALVLGAASTLYAGCYNATAIRLELGSDVPCTGSVRTAIYVGEPDAPPAAATAETSECGAAAPNNIGTVVLVPSAARDARMKVEVVLSSKGTPEACKSDPSACVVARRFVSFRKHDTRALPIFLSNRCLGVQCAPSETCVDGGCTSADVDDPAFCAGEGCDAGTPPPPPPPPPPPVDAGDDATVDPRLCASSPIVLARGVPEPLGPMRQSVSHLYWRTATGVAVLAKGAVSAPTELTGSTFYAVTNKKLVVANANDLSVLGFDTKSAVAALWQGATPILGIGASSDRLFVSFAQSVQEVNVDDLTTTSLFPSQATLLAANDNYIFLAENTGVTVRATTPQFNVIATESLGAPVVDVVAAPTIGVFITDTQLVTATPTLTRMNPLIATSIQAVAVNSKHIYFTVRANAGGALSKVRYRLHNDAQVSDLVTGLGNVSAIAADDACVYYWRRPPNDADSNGDIVAIGAAP